ncbi:MAG: GIY-YIG nuclease family protein [Pelolinea sp.]|nr:GIY-YIG nuclease family protein [Pelolinea sp.]
MPVYCYLLECADGSYYCGWAKDLHKRVAMHHKGKGARYTRMKAPVTLVYYEELEDRRAAMKREIQIKNMSHDRKRSLAEGFSQDVV